MNTASYFISDGLGWIAGVLGMLLGLAQLIHLIKIKNIAGVSLILWVLNLTVQFGWSSHGLATNNVPMTWASLGCGLISLLVLIFYFKYYKNLSFLYFFKIAALSLILLVWFIWTGFKLPAEVKGLVFAIPMLIGQTHQFLRIHTASKLKGISTNMLILYTINQYILFVWSFLIKDTTLLITSLSALVVLTSSIIRYYYRLKKLN